MYPFLKYEFSYGYVGDNVSLCHHSYKGATPPTNHAYRDTLLQLSLMKNYARGGQLD